jgi:hypothetical protein
VPEQDETKAFLSFLNAVEDVAVLSQGQFFS